MGVIPLGESTTRFLSSVVIVAGLSMDIKKVEEEEEEGIRNIGRRVSSLYTNKTVELARGTERGRFLWISACKPGSAG